MENAPNYPLDPSLKKLQIGYRFDNRFEIIANPVRRSHCFAFKVRDEKEGAIKVVLLFPQRIKHDSEALSYLVQQVGILSVLDHPQIAMIYGIHTEGPLAFIEESHVAGNTLKTLKLKKDQQRFSEEEVRWIAERLLDALDYAHGLNILHRDLKPANIVLTPDKTIKLIDFGLSEPIRHALNLVQDTSSSTIILYWSPEQVQGKSLTVQSDLYSLGAVMYDLLNGKPPFFTGDVYNNILYTKPEPLAHCSAFMNDLLLQALAKNPQERFKDAREMRAALQKTGISYFGAPLKMQEETQKEVKQKKKRSTIRSVLKPNIRYSLISAILIVVLAVMISRLQFGRPRTTPADSTRIPRQAVQRDSFQIKMLDALLKQAQEKIAQKQILTPYQSSALFLLQQAQKIDSTDQRLRSLLDEVKSALRQQIYALATSGQQVKAHDLLNRALQYFPNDSLLLGLQANLFAGVNRRLPLKIEILNGVGGSGIAHRLSRYLQKQKFAVVNTENYRVSGKINWQVRQSFLKGNIPPNPRIQALEQILGLPYQYDASFVPQNEQATLAIVLGKDYRNLKPFNKP